MFIRDLNQQGQTKIDKINKLLSEEFGMSIKSSYPKKEKLDKILEMSEMAIVKLKDTKKQFQLEPEYAKYLLTNTNLKVNLIFHNDPNSLRDSDTVEKKIFLLEKCNKIIFVYL